MTNPKSSGRRMLARIGMAIGLAAFASAAVSADGVAGFGNILTMRKSALVANEMSVVADEIRQEGEDCNQAADNTIGGAVKGAMQLHVNIAKKAPDIEPLFQMDCLSSLRQLWDISGAIGALGSITWAAVRQAILQAIQNYVQGRVCQAVNQVAGMINGAIDDVNNQLMNFGSQYDYLNGMSTGLAHRPLFNYTSLSELATADQPLVYAVQRTPFQGDAIRFENSTGTLPMIPPPPALQMPKPAAPGASDAAAQTPDKPADDLLSRMMKVFDR